MKKWFLFGTMSLLAGCSAGLKDSFDCNATAQDSCMTMEEANQKAAQKIQATSPSAQQHRSALSSTALPVLAPLATPVVPIATAAVKTVTSSPDTPVLRPSRMLSATSISPVSIERGDAEREDMGRGLPQRLPTSTARLWIAPWVDEHDNLYQSAVVSFVVKQGEWRVLSQ